VAHGAAVLAADGAHAEGAQDHGGLGGEGGDREDLGGRRGVGEQVGEVPARGERALDDGADGDTLQVAVAAAGDGEAVEELERGGTGWRGGRGRGGAR
jgi:hypothetical protein